MTDTRTVQYEIRWRLLVSTAVIFAVGAVVLHYWHDWQLRRMASAMLVRAEQLEKDEQYADAHSYLVRYLALCPSDAQAHVTLAKVYDRIAKSPNQKTSAIQLYYQAIGYAPNDLSLHSQLGELLLSQSRFADAQAQAKIVLKAQPSDAAARKVLAQAEYAKARTDSDAKWDGVVEPLIAAIKANPTDLQLSVELADVYRSRIEPHNPAEADSVMDQLVIANANSAEALLQRMAYRRLCGIPGDDADLDAALQADPQNPMVLLAAGERAQKKKNWREAHELYAKLIELQPNELAGYFWLGKVCLQEKDVDNAIAVWRTGAEKVSVDNLKLRGQLFEVFATQNRLADAQNELKLVGIELQSLQSKVTPRAYLAWSNQRDLMCARIWLMQNDLSAALPVLKRLDSAAEIPPELMFIEGWSLQVEWLLAGVLGEIQQWDDSATAYERLVAALPNNPAARLAAARAWVNAGQPEAALRHYELLLAKNGLPAEAWEQYLQVLFQKQSSQPAGNRNWSSFEKALRLAPAEINDRWQVMLLRANQVLLTGHTEEAFDLLHEIQAKYSENAPCLRALGVAFQKLDKPDDADRALDQADHVESKSLFSVLARATVLSQRGEHDRALEILASAEKNQPESDRTAVQRLQVQELLALGKLEEGRELLAKIVEHNPSSVRDKINTLRELAELAIQARDTADAEQWEQKLHEIEGQDGANWRFCRAERLLEAASPKSNSLQDISQLVTELEQLRPTWSQTHLLRAKLSEREGNLQQAISSYQQTISLGDQRLQVYQSLISLLYQNRQFDEAEKLLSQLNEKAAETDAISSMAIAVSLRRDEIDRGLEMAKSWIERKPDDPAGYIWLGQALLLEKRTADAEVALRKATEVAPGDVRAWHVLFYYYVQSKQPQLAAETLEALAAHAKLPETQKELLLGQEYELLGNFELAAKHLQAALTLSPNDPGIQQRLAAFIVRWNNPAADQVLKELIAISKGAEVRRTLAIKLASQGAADSWDKAMKLLSQADSDPNEIGMNNRVRAGLLSNRGREQDQQQAIKLLLSLVSDAKRALASDRMLLARLYEAVGQPQAAREQYELLVNGKQADPACMAGYADFLLRTNQTSDADFWIKKFEKESPGTFMGIAMRARLLRLRNRTGEVESLVEPFLKQLMAKPNSAVAEVQIYAAAGQLYADLGLVDLAAKHLEHAYQISPEAYAPWVSLLVSQKRTADALNVCEKVNASRASAQPALNLAIALNNAASSPAECELAEAFLSSSLAQYPENLQLLLAISGVRYLEGNLDEVIKLSRAVLEKDPQNVMAMNNLSSLLSEQSGREAEAITLVDRAIRLEGRSPTLLDTKAIILLHQGDAKSAVELLDEALSRTVKDARIRFHRALAYQRLNNVQRARDNLEAARGSGLKPTLLTPMEQQQLVELEKFVGQEKARKDADLSLNLGR